MENLSIIKMFGVNFIKTDEYKNNLYYVPNTLVIIDNIDFDSFFQIRELMIKLKLPEHKYSYTKLISIYNRELEFYNDKYTFKGITININDFKAFHTQLNYMEYKKKINLLR